MFDPLLKLVLVIVMSNPPVSLRSLMVIMSSGPVETSIVEVVGLSLLKLCCVDVDENFLGKENDSGTSSKLIAPG